MPAAANSLERAERASCKIFSKRSPTSGKFLPISRAASSSEKATPRNHHHKGERRKKKKLKTEKPKKKKKSKNRTDGESQTAYSRRAANKKYPPKTDAVSSPPRTVKLRKNFRQKTPKF